MITIFILWRFDIFLIFAIKQNEYDKKTKEYFKHVVEDYIFEKDHKTYIKQLHDWANDVDDEI